MKYYLIVADSQNKVHFFERNTIIDIYELIVTHKLPESAYKIIKGVFIK